jgi:hypothetical protein
LSASATNENDDKKSQAATSGDGLEGNEFARSNASPPMAGAKVAPPDGIRRNDETGHLPAEAAGNCVQAGKSPSVPPRESDSSENDSRGGTLASYLLALLLALMGAAFISFFALWHEVNVMRVGMPQIVVFSLTPVVFFLMFTLVMLVNPALRLFSKRLAFGRRELVLVLSVWLLAGAICLRNQIVSTLFIVGEARSPIIQSQATKLTKPEQYLKPSLFLTPQASREYFYGKPENGQWISPAKIAWREWSGPAVFWIPYVVLIIVFAMSLTRVMHRQWSRNELLSYPIAQVAEALVISRSRRMLPDVCYSRSFWAGFAVTAFIFLMNGLHSKYPLWVAVPMEFEHRDLVKDFPFLSRYCGTEAYSFFRGWVWPFAVSIAVLVPTEISLTCWLGYVLMILGAGFHFLFTGDAVTSGDQHNIQIGMYLAAVGVILYLGRREYVSIARLALTPWRAKGHTLAGAAMACRVFLISFAGLWVMLIIAGLDWVIAFALVCGFSALVILAARITAEVGMPWLANFNGMARLLAVQTLGPVAMGPQALIIVATIGGAMDFDTSNTVAAQETTLGKLKERLESNRSRRLVNLAIYIGLACTLVAGVFLTLWDNYSFGAQIEGTARTMLATSMTNASREVNRLEAEGGAQKSQDTKGVRKLFLAKTEARFWRFAAYGTGIILMCTLMRLRFAWWPIHPIPFLLTNTWALSRLYHSFFIGWAIKAAILRIAGGEFYARSRPFFIGLIMGQLVMGITMILVADLGFVIFGVPPTFVRFFA